MEFQTLLAICLKKNNKKTTTENQRKTPHDESVLFSHLNIN